MKNERHLSFGAQEAIFLKRWLGSVFACAIFVLSAEVSLAGFRESSGAEFDGYVVQYADGHREVFYPDSGEQASAFLSRMQQATCGKMSVVSGMPNYVLRATASTNDPFLSSQEFLLGMNVLDAWDFAIGSPNCYVAVFDTGIKTNHPDLLANIAMEYAQNTIDGTPGVEDVQGHGTHCSGIVGGVGNNSIGIAGIAWQTKIIPVKMLNDSGQGTSNSFFDAIDYLVDLKTRTGINVAAVNCSFGGRGTIDQLYYSYMQKLKDAGILAVCGAGNDSENCDTVPFYPACIELDNVISVGASDQHGNMASFSNFGATKVDVFAAGVSIFSTCNNGDYCIKSGTSMAAPVVSGVAALLRGVDPTLKPERIREIIMTHAVSSVPLAGRCVTGGYVDAAASVREVAINVTPTITPTVIPTIEPTVLPTTNPTVQPTPEGSSGGGGSGCTFGSASGISSVLLFLPWVIMSGR